MKILVTAALPYSNARLHLGHLRSTYIPADIFARYLRLKGKEIAFICASDDHGTPIAVRAEKEGVTPREIVDKYHKLAYEDLTKMGCSFDVFAQTSLPLHYEVTKEFFKRLYEKGYIYAKMDSLPYCVKCKRFLPDRYVEGTCPYCGNKEARGDECDVCGRYLKPLELKEPRCVFCFSKPKAKKTKHWFFKLSEFQEFLKQWIESNKSLPKIVRHYALAWIKEGLRDWCISRDLDWGAPLPLEEAKGKVLYVWFDAPIGYITSTIIWSNNIGRPDYWREFWQGKDSRIIHFIGKGIIYHHSLFWPAMLKGTEELNLPSVIVAGGHCTLEKKKMSKSKGWVVEIEDYLKSFHPDLLRYYLISTSPLDKDSDFSWRGFAESCNSELADILGNFIHRTLSFVYNNYRHIPKPKRLDEYDKEMLDFIKQVHEEIQELIEKFDFHSAIRAITKLASRGNKYLSDKEPWKVIKEDPQEAATTLYVCAQAVKALAIWMEPFLPYTAERLWKLLNLKGEAHSQSFDEALAHIPAGHEIAEPKPLFKKITDEEIREQEAKLPFLAK